MYREIIKARLSEQLRITTRAYGDLERVKYCFSSFALLFLLKLSGKEECWKLVLSVCGEVAETDGAMDFQEA